MSYCEVKDYLGELTSVSLFDEDEILSLCRSSLKEIEAKLRGDADRTDIRIVAAAAGLAYYKLALKQSRIDEESDITSFSAGDVSVTQNSVSKENCLKQAESFYKKTLEALAPMCQDNSFVFRQIRMN